MAKKFNVTGEQHYGITGQMLEIQRQLRLKGGSPLDPEYVKHALQDIIQPKHDDKEENTILRLLSRGENIIIPACDGSKIIASAEDMFRAYIDSDFKNWGLNKPGPATAEVAVQVYEMAKDATFTRIFGSLGADLDKLCLTQHQIITFCKDHADWLRADGYATLFLFKIDGYFFVANVYAYPVGLYVGAHRFGYDSVWLADRRHRVVLSQQIA